MTRTIEQIAIDVLKSATSREPDACLVGNVTALELGYLAASRVMTCPSCGSTAWVNIDCRLCLTMSAVCSQSEVAG